MFKKKDQELIAEAYESVLNEISAEFMQKAVDRKNYADTAFNRQRASKIVRSSLKKAPSINVQSAKRGESFQVYLPPTNPQLKPEAVEALLGPDSNYTERIIIRGVTVGEGERTLGGGEGTSYLPRNAALELIAYQNKNGYIQLKLISPNSDILFTNRGEANKFIQYLASFYPELKALRSSKFEIAVEGGQGSY
jgi:hypothetical protein